MKKLMKKIGFSILTGACLSLPAFAAIDISTQVATFTTSAEGYVVAALPAVFVIVGLYFLVKVIKRFTK